MSSTESNLRPAEPLSTVHIVLIVAAVSLLSIIAIVWAITASIAHQKKKRKEKMQQCFADPQRARDALEAARAAVELGFVRAKQRGEGRPVPELPQETAVQTGPCADFIKAAVKKGEDLYGTVATLEPIEEEVFQEELQKLRRMYDPNYTV